MKGQLIRAAAHIQLTADEENNLALQNRAIAPPDFCTTQKLHTLVQITKLNLLGGGLNDLAQPYPQKLKEDQLVSRARLGRDLRKRDSERQRKGLKPPRKRVGWLRVDRLLGEWGIPEDSPAGRQRLERALEERRGMEEGEEFKPIRRGWCLGEEKFREELLTQMSEQMGAEHYGEERAETAEALAELIIAEELKRGRWQEADLKTRPKGDSVKVALAARLRAETTMTVGWIAERLTMGTRGYLNHLLYRRRKLGKE